MKKQLRARKGFIGAPLVAGCLGLLVACASKLPDSGLDASGGAGPGAGGAAGANTAGAGNTTSCSPPAPIGQRLVRLDFNQLAHTLQGLLGSTVLDGVTLPGNTLNVRRRQFLALMAEGDFFNDSLLGDTVNLVEGAVAKLGTPAAVSALTGCAAPLTDACIQGFLPRFAQATYRRPLTSDEQSSVLDLYTTLLAGGSPTDEAARFAIEGVLLAPQALYRSEFGAAPAAGAANTTLSPYEVASALSFFLLDGPPDQPLLDAAAQGALGTADGVAAQVDRLLADPRVVENLNQVMGAFYQIGNVDPSITPKDATLFPGYTSAVTNSLYAETDNFLRHTLWQGKLTDLVTSKTSYINQTLAQFYGIQNSGATSPDVFVPYEYTDGKHAGILTQGSFLAIHSRVNTTSVVSRGLYIEGNVVCGRSIPPPPTDPTTQALIMGQLSDPNATERAKAEFRSKTSPCLTCHTAFDPYGIALETFDAVGRYRASYADGTPIDTSSQLQDGTVVHDIVELENTVAQNGVFARCLGTNLVRYALAQAQSTVSSDDCAMRDLQTAFNGSDQSFSSMIRSIALSSTLSTRTLGVP